MYELIKAEIEKIRKKYLESAEEIVSGYNRECSLSKDYEGRQMFELLQMQMMKPLGLPEKC